MKVQKPVIVILASTLTEKVSSTKVYPTNHSNTLIEVFLAESSVPRIMFSCKCLGHFQV